MKTARRHIKTAKLDVSTHIGHHYSYRKRQIDGSYQHTNALKHTHTKNFFRFVNFHRTIEHFHNNFANAERVAMSSHILCSCSCHDESIENDVNVNNPNLTVRSSL